MDNRTKYCYRWWENFTLKNLYIYGAGYAGAEIYYLFIDELKKNNEYSFKGFISGQNNFLKESELNNLYLGSEEDIEFDKNDYIVLAIGENLKFKQKIVEELKKTKVNFCNLIHSTANIVKCEGKIGIGNIFYPLVYITNDVEIGDFNLISGYTAISHNTKVGNFNTFSGACRITGCVTIGDANLFGTGAIMLPHSKIGNNNKIAAASVIYKKFRNNSLIAGNPAIKMDTIE